jgi:hypothetical protein
MYLVGQPAPTPYDAALRSTMNRCLRIISTRFPASSRTTVIAQRPHPDDVLREPQVVRKLNISQLTRM